MSKAGGGVPCQMQPFPLGQIFFSRHDSKTVQQVWSANVYHQQHERGKVVKFTVCININIDINKHINI